MAGEKIKILVAVLELLATNSAHLAQFLGKWAKLAVLFSCTVVHPTNRVGTLGYDAVPPL